MNQGDRIGRYQVIRRLGHGGLGDVFLAFDASLEREVAIKLLHKDAAQAGLREEARTLAALRHPNVVRVYEIGEHDGQDFIAMEYVPGRSLRHVLMEGGVSRKQLLDMFGKVCAAVQAAHRARVLHRDLKPENVLVTPHGEVTVVDFGQARRLEHTGGSSVRALTASEIADSIQRTYPPEPPTPQHDTILSVDPDMVGTPAYMAPEVMVGNPSEEASDVYSLGVMLYECLAGRRPWSAHTLVELIAQMIEEPPAPLDDPLAPLALRMLAREPLERPSLDEVLAALKPQLTTPQHVTVPLPPPAPAPPRRGNLRFAVGLAAGIAVTASAAIAFVATRSRTHEVVPAGPAGPLPHQRITAAGRDRMVDWGTLSPDGTRVAYSDPDGLHVQDTSSGARTDLPLGTMIPRLVTWFPDGKALLVTTCSGATDCNLYRVELSGGTPDMFKARAAGGMMSPDGKFFAYYNSDGEIVIASATDPRHPPIGHEHAVTFPREPPAWSPDSSLIAFITRTEEGYAIAVRGRDGGTHHMAVDARLSLADERFGLAFLPDGRLVYAIASEPGEMFGTTLWAQTVDATGAAVGPPVELARYPGVSVSHLSASSHAARLAAIATSTQGDIYVADLAPGTRAGLASAPRRLTVDDRDDRGAAWFDDDTVMFASDRRGHFAIYAQAVADREPRLIVEAKDPATWPVRRGDDIAYWQTRGADGEGAFVTEIARSGSGSAQELQSLHAPTAPVAGGRPPPIGVGLQCAAPPSTACIVSQRKGSEVRFFVLGADHTIQISKIGAVPGENWEWSLRRDGKAIAFPDGDHLVIISIDPDNQADAQLVATVPGAHWHCVTWDADGEGLYATGILPGADEFQLAYIAPGRPDTRNVTKVWSTAGAWIGEPAVSPDGKRLAFTVKPLESDVWTIELP